MIIAVSCCQRTLSLSGTQTTNKLISFTFNQLRRLTMSVRVSPSCNKSQQMSQSLHWSSRSVASLSRNACTTPHRRILHSYADNSTITWSPTIRLTDRQHLYTRPIQVVQRRFPSNSPADKELHQRCANAAMLISHKAYMRTSASTFSRTVQAHFPGSFWNITCLDNWWVLHLLRKV